MADSRDNTAMARSAPAETPLPINGTHRFLDVTVMMVDDEPTTLEVMQVFLEEAGYRNIVATSNPVEAMDVLAEARPDIVLLGLMMPKVSGFDILRKLRADDALRHIPVIVLTSSTAPEAKLKALELGAADFLAKPVDPSELVLRLRNTLAARDFRDRRGGRGLGRDTADAPAQPELAGRDRPVVSSLAGNPRLQPIIGKFTARLAEQLDAMERAWEARDFAALASLAHWLHGAAGTVGYDAFTEPATALRAAAKTMGGDEIGVILGELRRLSARIVVPNGMAGRGGELTNKESGQ